MKRTVRSIVSQLYWKLEELTFSLAACQPLPKPKLTRRTAARALLGTDWFLMGLQALRICQRPFWAREGRAHTTPRRFWHYLQPCDGSRLCKATLRPMPFPLLDSGGLAHGIFRTVGDEGRVNAFQHRFLIHHALFHVGLRWQLVHHVQHNLFDNGA